MTYGKQTNVFENPDNKGETIIQQHIYGTEHLVDAVKEVRDNYADAPKWMKADGRLKMLITGELINAWCIRRGVTWEDFWADTQHFSKLLANDPELKFLRVDGGRV